MTAWKRGDHVLLPDELALWQERIDGTRRRLPNGFWGADRTDQDGWARGLACARYLLDDRLGMTREQLLALSMSDIGRYGLGGFKMHWRCSIYDIVSGAYPELQIQPWEMRHVAHDYWLRGGRAAKLAALRWWLEQHHLSAAEAYRQLATHQGTTIRRDIERETNMVESGDYIPIPDLLREIDPSIAVYQGRRKQQHRRRSLLCPLCGDQQGARGIMRHLVYSHRLDRSAARVAISAMFRPGPGWEQPAVIAAQTGVWPQTVRKAARLGQVPAVRHHGRWWIDTTSSAYAAWLAVVQAAPRHRAASDTLD